MLNLTETNLEAEGMYSWSTGVGIGLEIFNQSEGRCRWATVHGKAQYHTWWQRPTFQLPEHATHCTPTICRMHSNAFIYWLLCSFL